MKHLTMKEPAIASVALNRKVGTVDQSAYRKWKSEGKPRQRKAYQQMCGSKTRFKRELKTWKRRRISIWEGVGGQW